MEKQPDMDLYLLPCGNCNFPDLLRNSELLLARNDWCLPDIYKNSKTITVSGKDYRVCPDAVAKNSNFFASMFSSFREKNSEIIPIDVPCPEVFNQILPFLHSGLLDYRMVTLKNCCKLIRIADYLDAQILLDHLKVIVAVNHKLIECSGDFSSLNLPFNFIQETIIENDQYFESSKAKAEFLFLWSRDFRESQTDLEMVASLVKKQINAVGAEMNYLFFKNLKDLNPELFACLDCLNLLGMWESQEEGVKRKAFTNDADIEYSRQRRFRIGW